MKNGVTTYVGRTKNFVRRAADHLRKGRRIEAIEGLTGISYKRARAIEHLLIEKYGRIRDRAGNQLGGTLDNLIRGIDPTKLDKYAKELEWARKKIQELGL